jgi:FlaA1/EpsC-like NDP-sugar epimerase
VLGATKRLAEMIVRRNAGRGTRVASVRFGNVLGSRGSLLSVLQAQIERGEAVTITHPDVTRFFMTVEEAVGLVLEAAAMADQGETFVLDMGKPVRIVDLVHNYASQLHMEDVEICFTGLRPGEKLDESLVASNEERELTAHPKIWNTRDRSHLPDDFEQQLNALYALSGQNNAAEVRRHLSEIVAGYEPSEGQRTVDVAPYPDEW